MNKTVRDKLVSMREEKYREFSSALIPGCENMLGVRVPVIRKYAKEILKENTDWQKILEEDDVYFEETMLRGFIIGMATLKEDDVELAKEKLAEFVTYIDNWSINDSFCNAFKIAGKHGEDFIAEIEKMVKSKKEYEARAGLILLLNHYVKVEKRLPERELLKFVIYLVKIKETLKKADIQTKYFSSLTGIFLKTGIIPKWQQAGLLRSYLSHIRRLCGII